MGRTALVQQNLINYALVAFLGLILVRGTDLC